MKHFNGILKLVCLGAGLLAVSVNGYSWGQKGHDVTCALAEKHLTKKAKIHASKNIDADKTYENAPLNENGDVVRAINEQITALKSGKLSRDEQVLSLKFLVHLMGDLHCPMHMGHMSDRGGNKWQVQFFRSGTNLHSIWDSSIIESAHKWTYSEWVDQIDINSKSVNEKFVEGNPESWGKETYEICKTVYDATPVGSKLSYDYVSDWTETIENQLLRAGLRLASVLNDIFK